MSKFYDEIAEHYDSIFPVRDFQLNCILENLEKTPSDILDVACGTGGYAIKLYEEGHHLTAIDLDTQMIKAFQDKNSKIDSFVMDMLALERLNKSFDLIYCLGNSIVHLDSLQLMEQFFLGCYKQLNVGGRLIIQVVNYDRILDGDIRSLPTISNEEANLTFTRKYTYLKEEHKIEFHTILRVKEKELDNKVKLFPIRSKEIEDGLKRSGFKNIRIYGDFAKKSFKAQESTACVAIAEKKS